MNSKYVCQGTTAHFGHGGRKKEKVQSVLLFTVHWCAVLSLSLSLSLSLPLCVSLLQMCTKSMFSPCATWVKKKQEKSKSEKEKEKVRERKRGRERERERGSRVRLKLEKWISDPASKVAPVIAWAGDEDNEGHKSVLWPWNAGVSVRSETDD